MKTTCVLIFVVSIAIKTLGQWVEKNNGLYDRTINTVATSGTNLIAAGDSIYLSANGGASWTSMKTKDLWLYGYIPPVTLEIYSLAASGSNLYAATADGVYLSTSNGVSWKQVSTFWGVSASSLAVKGDTLFGCNERGVFRSVDNGNSWEDSFRGVRCVVVGAGKLYAVTDYEGVFLSAGNDTSWIAVNTGIGTLSSSASINGIGVITNPVLSLAENEGSLFVATGADVLLSTNNGANWTTISKGLAGTNFRSVALIGNDLFVGGDNGVWSRPLSDIYSTIAGVITKQGEELLVYPNPVETHLELKGNVGEIKQAQLFDMTGGALPILFEESDVYMANVQNLSQGLYLLRVEDKISVRTIKFVKK